MNYIYALAIFLILAALLLTTIWYVRKKKLDRLSHEQRIKRIAEYKTWQWLFGRAKHRRLTYQPSADENAT